jgi:arylsulfatase A-like enzyme/Tfp pilus assembly protein PilF
LLVVAAFAVVAPAAASEPSLLLVTLDTTRADHLAPYGAAFAETPTLTELARRGVVFERAYATTPVTLPSHASILTGLDPPRHGVRDNGIHHLPDDVPTLASLLRGAGYRTAAFVSAAVLERRYGLDSGFEVYDDDLSSGPAKALLMVAERRAAATVDAALAWIDDLPDDERFFLWVHLFDPHAAYEPPPPFDRRFAERPYDGEIAYADAELGRLLAQPRIADRAATVVTVLGDHGEGLGEHGEETHGMLAYDSTLRVPFLLRAPGNVAGLRVAAPVSQVDVLPTLLELLGLEQLVAPLDLDGTSFAAAALGRAATHAPGRALYAETLVPLYAYGWAPLRTVRRLGFKLVDAPAAELYHLDRDPREMRNLYADEPERGAELQRLLDSLHRDAPAPAPLPLDAESAAKLRSLGYLAGSSRPDGSHPAGSRPDPKAMMEVHRAMTRAKRLLLERRLDDAVAELGQVLQEDPSNLDAIQSLAVAHGELGDTDEAVRAVKRGLELVPDDVEMLVTLASLERGRGRPDIALVAADRALTLDARSLEARLERATVLGELGRPDQSATEIGRALELSPEDPRANVAWARAVEVPAGEHESAQRRLEDAVRREPFLADGWLVLGRVVESRGGGEQAETVYRRGLSAQPLYRPLLVALGELLAGRSDAEGIVLLERAAGLPGAGREEVLVALADALRSQGREDDARGWYEQVVATAAAATPARGQALFFLGRLDEAAEVFRSVLEADPQVAEAEEGLAGVALARRDWPPAERRARRAVELEPGLASAWNTLAVAVEEQGRLDEAHAAYERALDLAPGFWEARFNRGLLLRRLGRFPQAAADFAAVLARLPGHAKSHYELGVLYGGPLARPELARSHLEEALTAEPDHPRTATIQELLARLPP